MAAILPFLETEQQPFVPVDPGEPQQLHGLGSADSTDASASTHSELSRLIWIRRLLENAISTRKWSIERDGRDYFITLDHALDRNTIPWSAFPPNGGRRASLFSSNTKMRCPTFDLPAGAPILGGACPGAVLGQSTVPMSEKRAVSPKTDRQGRFILPVFDKPVDPKTAVCQYCYASGGPYLYTSTQFTEVLKFAWVRTMMATPEGIEAFIQIATDAILTLNYTPEISTKERERGVKDFAARYGVRAVRVHSSGDFFSPSYAAAWIEIANRVGDDATGGDIRLWAPTRTHVVPSFDWPKLLSNHTHYLPGVDAVRNRLGLSPMRRGMRHRNFVIRASAYNVGDPAPGISGRSDDPGYITSKGTSVLTPEQAFAAAAPGQTPETDPLKGNGELYDHQCGVYALEKGEKTCIFAKGPDGEPGCRACWTRPDIAVNYVAH